MSNPRIPRKPGQPANSKKHSDLYTDENPKGTIHGLGFKDVATAKASVSKIRNSSRSHAHKIQAAVAMEQRAREMGKTSEAAVYRKFINQMKEKTKEMNEEMNGKCKAGYYYCYTDKKCKPIPKGFKVVGRMGMLRKENGHSVDDETDTKKNGNGNGNGNGGNGNGNGGGTVSEEGLRDWFGKSKSKGGKPGWVQVVSGKPCARQPGQKSTPKCVSSAKRASMSKSERESAQRRKRAADPNQPQKTGAAKPTYVSTDKPKKKMSESTEFVTLPLQVEIPSNIRDFNLGLMFRESLEENSGMLFIFDEAEKQSFHMTETRIPLDIAFITHDGIIESIKQLEPLDETPVSSDGDDVICALEVNRGWFEQHDIEVGDEIDIEEGKKDACYHKVKSRYSVWPSAYASGALVKCRKVGAANWGNKSKKEETEYELDEKCWKGYEKKGMKTMFGKRYPNCVKKEETEVVEGKYSSGSVTYVKGTAPVRATYGGKTETFPKETYKKKGMVKTAEEVEIEEAAILPRKTGQIVKVLLTFRGKMYAIQMFFPSIVKPSRAEVQDQIEKVYPGGKVRSYDISDYEPGQPLLHTEETLEEFAKKNPKKIMQTPVKNLKDFDSPGYVKDANLMPGSGIKKKLPEDWQKKSGKNPEGGLNEKGRKSYERQNPGSDLKRPSKKVGNPRRASFCARMKGMKKKLTSSKTANDPDSRINKSLRAWNC
jgi:uncharacterized membrane protein (UPF0127 family)